ncbi:hypothetical protein ACIBQ0_26470 [Nocardia nova]|uniref:hypothetical protein n=1 Tax=Nocardia nova TaxID=37330 RepID=UPI0037990D8E
MNVRRAAAGAALAAATLSAVPAAASADDPEVPRNGILPGGTYHITQHPDNMIGSPVHNCDLQVFVDGATVTLVCGNSSKTGRQNAAGPDETYVTFEGMPTGLDLHAVDAPQGYWEGTLNAPATSIDAPYSIAGFTLQRR